MSQIKVPVSFGELIDKITILEIKSERIRDDAKLANVANELRALNAAWSANEQAGTDIASQKAQLKTINAKLWDIEDQIRMQESRGEFGQEFIDLARAVYLTNDERAAVKREINTLLGSDLVEEKSYADYHRGQC
ncbi:MAG: DUF6165 family protein [Gammaproteobacteria bacterium]